MRLTDTGPNSPASAVKSHPTKRMTTIGYKVACNPAASKVGLTGCAFIVITSYRGKIRCSLDILRATDPSPLSASVYSWVTHLGLLLLRSGCFKGRHHVKLVLPTWKLRRIKRSPKYFKRPKRAKEKVKPA
ncbi:hypothetical protein NDU88_001981 [Pleurodeles waltl]|uniref:Uncharacterized protein n=1 Tax=Pleurodeles waltl TaxID=8319 RepID=A0AAV7TJX9_PLEWA|nr:hypothetical protein NDU88_001981 [Pleurodeles waltl]